jgi:hypothetical protein
MAKKPTNADQTRNRLLGKIADPKDGDDPRWVRRILEGFEKRVARKEKAKDHKDQQKKTRRSTS